MIATSASATYTKLRDGSWGIRVKGSAAVGEQVTVTTKAGANKAETVKTVIWSGNGISICAILQRPRPQASSWRGQGGAWNGCSMGCREGIPNPRCRSCMFDEFDN